MTTCMSTMWGRNENKKTTENCTFLCKCREIILFYIHIIWIVISIVIETDKRMCQNEINVNIHLDLC